MTAVLPELPDTVQRFCTGCGEWWPDDAEFFPNGEGRPFANGQPKRHFCHACHAERRQLQLVGLRQATERERQERLREYWRTAQRRHRARA